MRSIQPPSRLLLWLEGRVVLEVATLPLWLPWLLRRPRGDGHRVLVLPGFLAGDLSTAPLRSYLGQRGHRPAAWNLGRNLGYSEALAAAMNARVRALHASSGRRVSLVGWSLGGLYAREIARELPELVRQVVTLGSPFRGGGTGSHASGLYAALVGQRPQDLDRELLERIEHPPPVPCTAIHSRTDGVVAPATATERPEHERVETIAVRGSHFGLGVNPGAWCVLADRLAQPQGEWRPFAPRSGIERFLCRPVTDRQASASLSLREPPGP